MKLIHLQGKKYAYEEIKKGDFFSLPDYERKTLEFCQEWLNQKKNFTIHTSGSSGTPKSITISREQMIASAKMTVEALHLNKNDKTLVCLHTEFIAGKMMLVRSMETEMEMYILPPSSNPLNQFEADEQVDFTALVPFQLETILKESPEKKIILDRMKAILIGGAAISSSLEEKTKTINAPVYHTFGMTETLSHIALRRLNGQEKSEYFRLLPNVSISSDSRNCLIVNTPLLNHPLITNDVVEIIDRHHFKWLGRIDHVINSGGIKIHPEKIESKIEKIFKLDHPDKRFFVAGFPHAELGEAIGLVIEDKFWNEAKREEFRNKLKGVLSKHELPKQFYFKEKFEETSSGKTDRLKIKKSLSNY